MSFRQYSVCPDLQSKSCAVLVFQNNCYKFCRNQCRHSWSSLKQIKALVNVYCPQLLPAAACKLLPSCGCRLLLSLSWNLSLVDDPGLDGNSMIGQLHPVTHTLWGAWKEVIGRLQCGFTSEVCSVTFFLSCLARPQPTQQLCFYMSNPFMVLMVTHAAQGFDSDDFLFYKY